MSNLFLPLIFLFVYPLGHHNDNSYSRRFPALKIVQICLEFTLDLYYNCTVISAKKVLFIVDYKKGYYKLFNEITDLTERLKQIQKEAEKIVVDCEDNKKS